MAAPTATARSTPSGVFLEDGFASLITLAVDADICFWEKAVKPPGYDGGEPIDTTTMHNSLVRTKAPRSIFDVTPVTSRVAYDPELMDLIDTELINVKTTVTVTFSNGDTLAFFGYLRAFEPDELSEGVHPEATITIVPTNWDPTNNVEEEPVWSAAA